MYLGRYLYLQIILLQTGFIKAFSNAPISFTFGFHQVEKVMRALFVKELFLWPRYVMWPLRFLGLS